MIADAAHGRVDAPGRARSRAPAAPTRRRRRLAAAVDACRGPRRSSTPREGVLMDRLLFGDNQFFGVNHMSEEKARAQAMRFQDARRDHRGARRRLRRGRPHLHVHDARPRSPRSATTSAPNPERYADFTFYPCMPYAHKYANAVTEDGMLGAVRRFLPDEGLLDAARPRRRARWPRRTSRASRRCSSTPR